MLARLVTGRGSCATLVAGVLLLTASGWWFVEQARHNPRVRFLPAHAPAEWITHPLPPHYGTRRASDAAGEFRRTFELAAVPARAELRIRAAREYRVRINGLRVDDPHPGPLPEGEGAARALESGHLPHTEADANWKRERQFDVAPWLRAGANTITVEVVNRYGPPALWLVLDTGDALLLSDAAWESRLPYLEWTAARRAREPMFSGEAATLADRPFDLDVRPLDALSRRWPTLLIFASVAGLASWLLVRRTHSGSAGHDEAPGAVHAPKHGAEHGAVHGAPHSAALPARLAPSVWWSLAAVGSLWLVLFLHNARWLHIGTGFDTFQHLDYIRFIMRAKMLPLASDGWQMYQPPLFYGLAAMLVGFARQDVLDPLGIAVLRGLNLALALVTLAAVAGSLRLVFPSAPRRQIAGLVLAAFLPVNLYLFQYVTNENLLTTLAAVCVFLTLRLMATPAPRSRSYALLGAVLGAALLTKMTALVLVGVVLIALTGHTVARAGWRPTAWLSALGVLLAVLLPLGGWPYLRTWLYTRRLLLANWDIDAGSGWWQDPGYHTADYYLRAGWWLESPTLAPFSSLADSLWATLWGDALSGADTPFSGGPWNYELVAAGYLLAVVPAALVVVGAVAAAIEMVRRPRAEWFLLGGLALALLLALVHTTLDAPFFGQAKAWYVASGLVPFCVLGGWGFDLVAGRARWRTWLVATLLGTWALAAYGSVWINGRSARTHAAWGVHVLMVGVYDRSPEHHRQAIEHLQRALEIDPQLRGVRRAIAMAHVQMGQPEAALAPIEQALEEPLVGATQRSKTYGDYGIVLLELGRYEEAARALEQALRLRADWPLAAEVHRHLAHALLKLNRTAEALTPLRQSHRLRPGVDESRLLARLLISTPATHWAAPEEPIEVALWLCSRDELPAARDLDLLAAGYAACDRFDEAQQVAATAVEAAIAAGDAPLAEAIQERLARYRAGRRATDDVPPGP